jgi:hypothetical protein
MMSFFLKKLLGTCALYRTFLFNKLYAHAAALLTSDKMLCFCVTQLFLLSDVLFALLFSTFSTLSRVCGCDRRALAHSRSLACFCSRL